jgi:hypothetical protein
MKYCSECGAKIVGAPKYCEDCGAAIALVPDSPVAGAAPSPPMSVPDVRENPASTPAPTRTPRSATRKRRWLIASVAAIVVIAGIIGGAWKMYGAQQDTEALRAVRITVKAVGEALVAGDTAALEKQVVSLKDISLLAIAEVAPELMSQPDETLVSAFKAALSQNRLFQNIGQSFAAMREDDTTWSVSEDHQRAWFLSKSDVEGKLRIVLFVRVSDSWRLAYWTPPMTDAQRSVFITAMNAHEGSSAGIPGVAETLAIAGVSYNRMPTQVPSTSASGSSTTGDSGEVTPAQGVYTPADGTAEFKALLEAVQAATGKKVAYEVDQLYVDGDWAVGWLTFTGSDYNGDPVCAWQRTNGTWKCVVVRYFVTESTTPRSEIWTAFGDAGVPSELATMMDQ